MNKVIKIIKKIKTKNIVKYLFHFKGICNLSNLLIVLLYILLLKNLSCYTGDAGDRRPRDCFRGRTSYILFPYFYNVSGNLNYSL